MNTELLQKHFGKIGARISVTNIRRNRWGSILRNGGPGVDIRSDDKGEYFEIRYDPPEEVEYEVVEVRPDLRHLLMLARRHGRKEKFLCGHDERHWFVCAVPGNSVTSVIGAMEALQPTDVRREAFQKVKRQKNRLRRRNEAFVRQGEWFFIPAPDLVADEKRVFRNEPLSRGAGSKPHMCQFLYRTGGTAVMVCNRRPTGVTMAEYQRLIAANPDARNWNWRQMARDASVYVKGRVWHKDHKTIVLDCWHRVLMNTEAEAPGARAVAFLD